MPEGHSLELVARRLRPVVGARVLAGPLSGAVVTAVEARGKHLIVRADDGRCLDVHLGMHGAVRLRPPGDGRAPVVMATDAGDVAVAGTRRVRVTRASGLPRLGPEPLRSGFDAAVYLRRARAIDRPVGEMLLDQRVLAGVGNIVRCEALWRRRVWPFAPVADCSDRTLMELAVECRRLLRDGVASGGRLPAVIHRRTGRPCPRCGAAVRAVTMGEHPRRLYWCEGCQPQPAGRVA